MVDELADRSRLYRTSSKRLSTPLIVTVVLLLLVLLGGGYVYFQSQQATKKITSPQVTPSPTTLPTATPSPTSEATPSGSLTPSASVKPTTKPTGVSGKIDRSTITVTVLNGSGTAGLASKIGNYLSGLGYSVGTTGNADAFDYDGITINVKKSKSDILPQLKTDLSSEGTISKTSTTYTGSEDAQVIVGK